MCRAKASPRFLNYSKNNAASAEIYSHRRITFRNALALRVLYFVKVSKLFTVTRINKSAVFPILICLLSHIDPTNFVKIGLRLTPIRPVNCQQNSRRANRQLSEERLAVRGGVVIISGLTAFKRRRQRHMADASLVMSSSSVV